MNNLTSCDRCSKEFYLSPALVRKVEYGDLHVDYLFCPYCGAKYAAFVSDSKMRELVAARQRIRDKFKAGHQKKFREKTLRKYQEELDKIKAQQREILPELMKRGQELLDGKAEEQTDAEG